LREARGLIEGRVTDGPAEYAEMLADLHLCAALTRARGGDQGAWADWESARELVYRALPADYVGLRTRVSRPLVEVYAVMCAVDLGAPEEAQRRAHSLDPATIPSTERRGRHYVELARSADLEGVLDEWSRELLYLPPRWSVRAATHQRPVRPAWSCGTCGQPWPCSPARFELGEAYIDDPVGLLVHLCRLLILAAGETTVPVDELRERFIAWPVVVRG